MSTANRVIKNTGYLYAKMGVTVFISLYTTRLILNSLGASDFGIFNIVGGAISMLGFLNVAMASATQRFMSYSEGEGNKEKQKTIFNISFVLHIAIAILVGLVLLGAGFVFFNGVLNIPDDRVFAAQVVYGSLIVSTMFTVATVPYDAVINAHENMKYYAIVGVLESLLKLSVALIITKLALDRLIVYGALMACIPLITLTIMRIYCHKYYAECLISPRQYWDKSLAKEMGAYAGWNLLGSMSSMVGNYGYGIVVNHVFGTIVNAAMGIANQLNGQLMVFSNNMMKALNPVIVKSEGANKRTDMFKFAFAGSKFSFFLLAIFAIPFAIEAPYVLKIWLKNVPEWTIIFVRFQLLRSLLEQLISSFMNSLRATGTIKEIQKFSVVTDLLPLVIVYGLFKLGFPPYYLYIVAILIAVVFKTIIAGILTKKHCQISIRQYCTSVLYPTLMCGLFSLLFGMLPLLFMPEGIFRLVAVASISTLAFMGMFFFAGINHSEKIQINNFITKLKNK